MSETYTDNVSLSPDGSARSDWITQVTPGISVSANGPRLRLDASYAPEILHYRRAERQDEVFHRGSASGTLELADELLFVDGSARADQYDISLQGPLTTSNVNITGNRATATTASVSPYLLRRIGTAARVEVRLTYSAWESDDDRGALPDNTARRVHFRLASGPAFSLLTWDAAYSRESIEYETQEKTSTEELAVNAERRVTPVLSLLALAGYEKYEAGSNTLAESRWSAGVGWTPTQRTHLAVTAGRRLDNETYGLDFNHRTRLTTWNARYAEDVTTSREQFFVPATQSTVGVLDQMLLSQYPDPLARQKAVQELIARMGLPPSLDSSVNFFSDQLFLQKRWLASIGLHGVRNTLVASAFWERRDRVGGTGPVGDFAASPSIRTSGGSLTWGLRITPRTSWNFRTGYSRSVFVDSDQANDFLTLQAGLTRQLQRDVSGSLYYRLQKRSFDQMGGEYTENAVIASLLATF